ncbi:MAG: hypothetical protein ABIB47_03045 [Candidatus Woesearchaeota archaeon]
MKIGKIKAKKILSSFGDETIEIEVNRRFVGSAPLGLSYGSREVMPFPSNGIPLGIVNNTLNKALRGIKIGDFGDLKLVEDVLFDFDTSDRLHKLGGNVVIALENALLKASAGNQSVWKFLNSHADEMPMPIAECIGGGKHMGDSTDFQEFLIIPHAETFLDAAYANHYVYSRIAKDLKPIGRTCTGSWVTSLDNLSILDLLKRVGADVFDKFDIQMGLGVDVAGSHIYSGGYYFYKKGKLDREKQIRYVNSLITKYELEYVEDPLEENDVEGFGSIKGDLICGDDLVSGRLERLHEVAGKVNSVVIMPTQIGSLLKVKEMVDYCRENNIVPIFSHRAGETMDDTLCDLAVAFNVPYIKCGIFGKERLRKINRLKEIEKEI